MIVRRPTGIRFASDERGAVAALYALSLFALVAIAGVGFDYARVAAMDSELQNGADQAALAGATQLDKQDGACARAINAAVGLLNNRTLLANDGGGLTVQINSGTSIAVSNDACASVSAVRFYQDSNKSTVATTDETAGFVEVSVDVRVADYAFTPVVGVLNSGNIGALAMAGLGSSVCKVPPMMICSPDPSQPFNASGKVGWGIQVTGHGNTSSGPGGTVGAWGPGDFGFLEVGAGQNADLIRALAFNTSTLDCAPVDGTIPETGNPQGLYDAINTRFDVYDFSSGNGTVLAPCFSGSCPAANNVVKDLVKQDTGINGNKCKIHNQGWQLPPVDRQFWPKPRTLTAGTAMEQINDTAHSPSIDAMGLPRDNCHYSSYSYSCPNDANHRYGDGNWARGDYFNKYHSGSTPAGAATMTRYQTYLWEQGLLAGVTGGSIPDAVAAGTRNQYGAPKCSTGTPAIDRRVLTVAVVKNCASLSGASTAVEVEEWVDMFLVEPVVDARTNGSIADSIYMEVIREATVGDDGSGSGSQNIRRDVPYLVQ